MDLQWRRKCAKGFYVGCCTTYDVRLIMVKPLVFQVFEFNIDGCRKWRATAMLIFPPYEAYEAYERIKQYKTHPANRHTTHAVNKHTWFDAMALGLIHFARFFFLIPFARSLVCLFARRFFLTKRLCTASCGRSRYAFGTPHHRTSSSRIPRRPLQRLYTKWAQFVYTKTICLSCAQFTCVCVCVCRCGGEKMFKCFLSHLAVS